MEPYKFEQDIKNKLEKRTIQPSANSWDKLEGSLQNNDHKKNNKLLWFMGLAASIVGILVVVSIFLKEQTAKNTPIIVTSPELKSEESTIEVASEKFMNEDVNSEKIDGNKPTNNSLKTTSKKPIYNSIKQHNEVGIAFNKLDTDVVEKEEKIAAAKEVLNVTNISLEEQKIDSVILQITNLKLHYTIVTNSDIDALLFKAQQELALQKIVDESVKTVDAFKLLQDVEADLDKSIRVKFLETLKLNFENMKTVIAQRND